MNKGLEKQFAVIRAKLDFASIHSVAELEDRIDNKLDTDELYTLCLCYGCHLKDLTNTIWRTEIGGAKH